jgi:hypothetical protein
MGSGICAGPSMTAPRSGPRPAWKQGSTPCPNPGPGFPAPPIRRAPTRPWSRPGSILSARRKGGTALRTSFRPVGTLTRLHQGVSPRGTGKRRPVHPRRPVDGHGHGPQRGWRAGGAAAAHAQSRSSTPAMRQRSGNTGSNPMWWRRRLPIARSDWQGGWSWYTGSAAWMYRAWIEEVLGLQVRGSQMRINPVIPATWQGFSLRYRHGETIYAIQVRIQTAANAVLPGWKWMAGV